jgi:hypothetical protein
LEKPQSIRALFGLDGTLNAVHGSDSIETAQREITFWFPKPSLKGGKTLAANIGSNKFPEMSAYMNQVVDPVLAPIILRVSAVSCLEGLLETSDNCDGLPSDKRMGETDG